MTATAGPGGGAGPSGSGADPVPAVAPSPAAHGWRRTGRVLLIVVVLAATLGILQVILQTSLLLGRMTTDVSVAQQRATNLANSQREALLLLQTVTELGHGGGTSLVDERRALLIRQLTVASSTFPAGSTQHQELADIRSTLGGFPWADLADPARTETLRSSALALLSAIDIRVKTLYSQQESYFYRATLDSLQAKRDSQNALAGLVLLVVVLGLCWVILLKRRTRTDLAHAYHALVLQMNERQALQEQLSHQAYHDALTGLPNRALFTSRLTEVVRRSAAAAAVLIDLDGFKNINDTLGHLAGDELLQRVAERLRGCILDGDMVARLGGDEFAIVLPGGTAEHSVAVARRVIAALRRPISAAGQEVRIGASIGIAQLDGHGSAEDLLSDADIAMYAAKRGGKGRFRQFEPEMRDRTLRRSQLEQLLARAVALRQIEVWYQPIVDLATEEVTAVEALARWRLSDTEIVEPAVFIPIAEETGLITEIGDEVLRRACATVRSWRSTVPGAADLGVSVNVSGWQILSADYALQVAAALGDTGLPPDALTLEITESMLLEDSDALAAELDRIKALRVRLAMDDFGAGYSSLSSLRRFKVDTLKIDRMFLGFGTGTPGSLVRAVAELGRTLGMTVIAEGVETAAQLALVRAAHCDAVQGFLVSKPLPEADARLFLEWAATSDEIPALMRRATTSA